MTIYCEKNALVTESDVEQKFLYPFLHNESPTGLGYSDAEILTKHMLRPKAIGKGNSKKYYFPDYLITVRGIPMIVVEAKKPGEDLSAGYSEARLYAQEFNATLPHGINACQVVIASNGDTLWAGYYDQATPKYVVDFTSFSLENISFGDLISFCCKKQFENVADLYYEKIRGKTKYNSPVSQLGGRRAQNEEMEENTFGRTLVFENRRIFDPETEEDRAKIVENAYVASAKRDQHADPIYKEIKRFALPLASDATALSTDSPASLANKLSERIIQKRDAYSLILLIGNVGSGKTTFTRHFKQVYLSKNHPELANKCTWIFVDMNTAPMSVEEIYAWIKKQIIVSVQRSHSEIDFQEFATIQKIFRKDIQYFDKGIGSLLRGNEDQYKHELFLYLKEKMTNDDEYLKALLFFIKENYAHIPIVVLDNCDKRTKDEQLLMFEMAQWLRQEYECIVILPMRDSTYDRYRHVPPLDTVVRDLVFRIDPPDLLKVLQARLTYIERTTDQKSDWYMTENGITVQRKRSELIDYFRLIMVAIRKDRWIADIFYRLANKNTRNGIQMFEDFCKSGHMQAKDIFAIRVLGENAVIPTYRFENVLLRKNRKYYKDEESNFVNLFASNYNDDFPDPFIRVDILAWFMAKDAEEGPNGSIGWFSVSNVVRDLQINGHSPTVILREIKYMIKRELLHNENMSEQIDEGDLLKVSIPGKLHYSMLLNNVTYLAACAEDTYFKNTEIMMRISNRLKAKDACTKLIAILNATDLIEYLIAYRKEYLIASQELCNDDTVVPVFDISMCRNPINKMIASDPEIQDIISQLAFYQDGSFVSAEIVKKTSKALLCMIGEDRAMGYLNYEDPIHALDYDTFARLKLHDMINCEVICFGCEYKSFQLKFIDEATTVE